MSRPIDDKLISLRMDNTQFENNARTSLGTFAKLNETFKKATGINFGKSAKSLSELDSQAKGINFTALQSTLENIAWRFTNMGVIATAALQNITNRVVSLGIQLGKSISVAPLMDGLREYETKINSIQTIMSNTQGKSTMEDVTKTLDELNTYADKTIYNFGEMTRNIGTFTAAGVNLEDSTAAIKGIANLAAASGSSSQQASTAMYQLSQALAAGRVNLMDWNSVVNAGMGGKLFQNALRDTAESMGIAIDRSQNFRNTLQDGWLTTEVLLSTLQKFSTDTSMLDAATKVKTFTQLIDTTKEALGSGWAKTFELIIGDFEQARKRFTLISNSLNDWIDKSAEKRNAFFEDLSKKGMGDALFNTADKGLGVLRSWATTIGDIWGKIFPPISARKVMDVVIWLEKNISKLSSLGDAKWIADVKVILEGLFSVLSIGWTIVKQVASAFKEIIPWGMTGDVLGLVAAFAKFPIEWDKSLKSGTKIRDVLVDIGTAAKEQLQALWDGVSKITQPLNNASGAFGIFKTAASAVWDALAPIGQWFVDFIKSIDIQDVLNAGFIGGLIILAKKIGEVADYIVVGGSKMVDAFKDLAKGLDVGGKLDTLTGALTNLTTSVKTVSLLAIAGSMLALVFAMKMIEDMDGPTIVKTLTTLGAALAGLSASLMILAKIDMTGFKSSKMSLMLLTLTTSLMLFAGALRIVGGMDPDQMQTSLGVLVGGMLALVGAITLMSRYSRGMNTGSLALVGLATSMVILAIALEDLGKIDVAVLKQGLIGMGALLTEIAIFLRIVDSSSFGPGAAVGVTILAGAIMVMSIAVNKFGTMDIPTLVKGLSSLGVVLAELVLFSRFVNGGDLAKGAVGVTIMAAAIGVMLPSLKALGEMDLLVLGQGLVAIAVILLEFAYAAELMDNSLGGAVNMTIMAAAIGLLIPPLQALGSMSIGELSKSIIALAAAFGVIFVAALAFGTLGAGPLLIFAGGILAVGVAVLAAGAGISLFAAGLAMLATVTGSAIVSIVETFGLLLDNLIIIVPKIVAFAVVLVVGLADGIAKAGPRLFKAGIKLILDLLDTLADNIGDIVDVATDLVVQFADAIGENVPELVKAGVNLIIDFVNGLADTIRSNGPEFVDAVFNLMESILEIILTVLESVLIALVGWIPGAEGKISEFGDKGRSALRAHFKIDEDVADKTDDAVAEIAKRKQAMYDANKTLGESGVKGSRSVDYKKPATEKGGDFVNGLLTQIGPSKTAGSSLANAVKGGLTSVNTSRIGVDFGAGFAYGIGTQYYAVVGQAQMLANAATSTMRANLQVRSPSRVAMGIGEYVGEGFAIGMDAKKKSVWDSAKSLAQGAINATAKYASMFNDALNEKLELKPVIKPVLDMDAVKNLAFGGPKVSPQGMGLTATSLSDTNRSLLLSKEAPVANTIQNDYKIQVDNRGLLDGATLVVREEADLEKIAGYLDKRTAISLAQKGLRVVMP